LPGAIIGDRPVITPEAPAGMRRWRLRHAQAANKSQRPFELVAVSIGPPGGRLHLPGGYICALASVPSSGGRTGARRPLLHLACVLTRREGRAAQKRAELAVSFDQRPLTTRWADLSRGVTVACDGHVGVFKEFDDEPGHPSRVGDKQDRPACPGQRHVEKTAFLGVREVSGAGMAVVRGGISRLGRGRGCAPSQPCQARVIRKRASPAGLTVTAPVADVSASPARRQVSRKSAKSMNDSCKRTSSVS